MLDIPTHGLTDRQLKFSYWYITNELKLRSYLIIFLIVLSVLFYFYVGWQLVFYATEYQTQNYHTRRLLFGGNLLLAYVTALKPVPIEVSPIQSFNIEGNRNDFISQVRNNNANWLVTFDYQFVSNSDQTLKRKGFILPGEVKYLMDLGIEGSGVNLEISNQKWIKINDYEGVYNQKYVFFVTNEDFIAGQEAGDPNILAFDVINKSAYSYWEFPIQAFLYSSGNIISANYITIDQLKSGETRRIELFWNTKLPRITGYKIIPDVNILDETNIMSPERDVYLR